MNINYFLYGQDLGKSFGTKKSSFSYFIHLTSFYCFDMLLSLSSTKITTQYFSPQNVHKIKMQIKMIWLKGKHKTFNYVVE